MRLATALRRWLPMALLLAALGCAATAVQMPQHADSPQAAAHGLTLTPQPAATAAGQPIAESGRAAATTRTTDPDDGTVLAAMTSVAGCDDEHWAPAAPGPASPGIEAIGPASASPAAATPPARSPAVPDPGLVAASRVGLLLADLSVRRT